MKSLGKALYLVIGSLFFLGCDSLGVDPTFNTERRYKHDFYSSEEECRKLNTNYEFNCSEIVILMPDGKADILLGGGDIMVRTTYKRRRHSIKVNKTDGMSDDIVFKIVADNELKNEADKSKWLSY